MRDAKSFPVISNSTEHHGSMADGLECTLCFGLATAMAVAPGDRSQPKMEAYCNGTMLFKRYCRNIWNRHAQQFTSVGSTSEAATLCSTLGFCGAGHLAAIQDHFSDKSLLNWALLGIPITLPRGTA